MWLLAGMGESVARARRHRPRLPGVSQVTHVAYWPRERRQPQPDGSDGWKLLGRQRAEAREDAGPRPRGHGTQHSGWAVVCIVSCSISRHHGARAAAAAAERPPHRLMGRGAGRDEASSRQVRRAGVAHSTAQPVNLLFSRPRSRVAAGCSPSLSASLTRPAHSLTHTPAELHRARRGPPSDRPWRGGAVCSPRPRQRRCSSPATTTTTTEDPRV